MVDDTVTETRDPGLAYSGLARAVPARKPWLWVRLLFSSIWLVYLVQPLSTLADQRHGVAWLAVAAAVTAAFCAAFMVAVLGWNRRPLLAKWTLAALFALAVAFSALFTGQAGGNVVWIFVSSAAGWVLPDRRSAMRAVLGIVVCFLFFSWLGHVGMADTLVALIPVSFVGLTMSGLRIQMTLMSELRQAREEVAQLAANEERLRLARDMHDLTGQSLSMITLKSELASRLLDRLPASPDRDRARDEVEQVALISRQALHDIREAIGGYRRPTLAVEVITARTALASAGITSHEDTALTLLSGTFDPDAEAALAWCLREAVTNVIRHSGAKNCHISLTRQAGTVSLTVRDDGTGMRPDECGTGPAIAGPLPHSSATGTTGSGSGLRGMAERLHAVGGRLRLLPADGGFRLVAAVPEQAAAPDGVAPGQREPAGRVGTAGSEAGRGGASVTA